MQDFHGFRDFGRERFGVGSEIRVRQHCHHRFDTEIADGLGSHQYDVDQVFDGRTRVDGRVGEEHRSALGRNDLHRRERRVAVRRKDLAYRIQRFGVAVRIAEDRRIGVARSDHHQREPVAAHHVFDRLVHPDALAAYLVIQQRCVAAAARFFAVAAEVDDAFRVERQVVVLQQRIDLRTVADQQRDSEVFVGQVNGGLDRSQAVAFAEDDPARRGGAYFRADGAHQLVVAPHTAVQFGSVRFPVGDRFARDARFDSRFGHGDRDGGDQPRVEGLGDQVFASERNIVVVVGGRYDVGHRLLGQCGQRPHGGDLHLLVDLGGAHVERSAENVRESEYVIDLVRIVRASGCEDDVFAGGHRVVI